MFGGRKVEASLEITVVSTVCITPLYGYTRIRTNFLSGIPSFYATKQFADLSSARSRLPSATTGKLQLPFHLSTAFFRISLRPSSTPNKNNFLKPPHHRTRTIQCDYLHTFAQASRSSGARHQPSTPQSTTMSDYASLKVPDLKKLLSERSLPQSGNKADLIARLQENDKSMFVPPLYHRR